MSYEGYEDHICENGHHFSCDAMANYGGFGDDVVCHYCGGKSVWMNSIDQTNGNDVGVIPDKIFETLKIADEVTETCSHCGHTKVLEAAKYRVPSKEEHEKMQHYRDDNGKYIPLSEYEKLHIRILDLLKL